MAGYEPWLLRWRDVDPRMIEFDPTAAREIAQRAVPQVRPTYERLHGMDVLTHESRQGLKALEDEIDRALIAAYGPWISGWRWSTSEPGDGGPVRAWCCANARST